MWDFRTARVQESAEGARGVGEAMAVPRRRARGREGIMAVGVVELGLWKGVVGWLVIGEEDGKITGGAIPGRLLFLWSSSLVGQHCTGPGGRHTIEIRGG